LWVVAGGQARVRPVRVTSSLSRNIGELHRVVSGLGLGQARL
jgi:hypothetical protein